MTSSFSLLEVQSTIVRANTNYVPIVFKMYQCWATLRTQFNSTQFKYISCLFILKSENYLKKNILCFISKNKWLYAGCLLMFSLGFNLYGRYTAKTLAVCVKHLSINQSINQTTFKIHLCFLYSSTSNLSLYCHKI